MKPSLRLGVATGCALLLSLVLGYTVLDAQTTLRSCGNEGEQACGLFEKDAFNGSCDSGLNARLEVCGCLLRGFFGNCLIPRTCLMCRNDTRHRPATANLFASSWVNWALRNQREQLAVDEPLNWVMHLGTHNSFNSYSDGHQPRVLQLIPLGIIIGSVSEIVDAPNHFYSMTSQLDLGARVLAIDAHWGPSPVSSLAPDNARLCHSLTDGGPTLESAICLNPSLDLDGDAFPSMRYFANGIKELRNWLNRNPTAIVLLHIENYVGSAAYIADPLNTYLGARGWILSPPDGDPAPLPSRAEMLAAGKRVVVVISDDVAPSIAFSQGAIVEGPYESWLRNNQDFANCIDNRAGATEHVGPATAGRHKLTVVVEDRTLQRGFAELLQEILGQGPGAFGELSVDDMRSVARCNYGFVATDFLGSQLPLGRSSDRPDFSRHEALVWSWKSGDRGQNGDCAMLESSSGRWVSADCSLPKRYACAPPRSESGTDDKSSWNPREERWWITSRSGPWDGGPAACAAEFPMSEDGSTPFVFSVPVNGYQNDKLKTSNTSSGDVWLNYTDSAREGTWVIPRQTNVNGRPTANAGPDQTIECSTEVLLDGKGSTDPNGDPLTYSWSGPFGTLTGPVVVARLEAGVHVITLTVRDGQGGVDTDDVTITVEDTKPPALEVSLSPSVLSPANGELVKITATVRAHDRCDGDDVLIELLSIVSSEPLENEGEEDDIQGAELGTGDLEFLLRAKRAERGPGRVYSVTYRATDKAGNVTDVRTNVHVYLKN